MVARERAPPALGRCGFRPRTSWPLSATSTKPACGAKHGGNGEKETRSFFDISPCLPLSETSVFAKAILRRAGLESSRKVRKARKVLAGRSRRERRSCNVLVEAMVGRALRANRPVFQLFNLSTFQLRVCYDGRRRTRYGMLTFTRKNRLAAFVGPQSPSVRLSRPSTV